MSRSPLWLAPVIGLSAACSMFSQTISTDKHDRVHAALPAGISADEAQARLNGLDFSCTRRTGDYPDESGSTVTAEHFLSCVQRPGIVSFACENRDQVYVALLGEVVDKVSVVRGPNCSQR